MEFLYQLGTCGKSHKGIANMSNAAWYVLGFEVTNDHGHTRQLWEP